MYPRTLLVCATLFLILQSETAFAQRPEAGPQAGPTRIYTTTRLTTERPVIDGILDDPAWETGEWAGDFTQWIPKEGAKPTFPTHLKILYDNHNLYIAIRAFDDEPDKVSRKTSRRDAFGGDIVGVTFDSFFDRRTGFEFNVTAAGQKIDLILTNPQKTDMSWDAVWEVKTALEDSAWTAEYRIPLSQLRYSGADEQVWGLHCWRWINRLQEESDWDPQTSTGPGMLYQFGELHGIRGLPKSRRFEVLPYTLGRLNTFEREPANPFADRGWSSLANLGLDAKVGLTSNFTADITVNPDFGQVEADPSVLNLTAFEVFFEEKRPFFLEGKSIFDFEADDASLFYSRRIGHVPSYTPGLEDGEFLKQSERTTILSATKASGKTADGLSVGLLHSLTARETARIAAGDLRRDIAVEPLTNHVVGRVQKDFKEGNTMLGGILTSTNRSINESHLEFLSGNAFTGGLDLLHHWKDKEFYVDVRLMGSHLTGEPAALRALQIAPARYFQRPDADHLAFDSTRTRLSGTGGGLTIGKGSKGLWRYSTALNWRSPGLELNDIGFMQRADIVRQENAVSYFVTQPVGIFRTYSIGVSQFNHWDFDLNHLLSGAGLNLRLGFLNKWTVAASVDYGSEALATRLLRGGPGMVVPAHWQVASSLRTDTSRRASANLSARTTVSSGSGARFWSLAPGVSVQPIDPIRFAATLEYASNADPLQYVTAKPWNGESRYILGGLDQETLGLTFRIDYSITTEMSIQYYVSPFASVGTYSAFKSVTSPRADSYDDRFEILDVTPAGNVYTAPEGYSFGNPDFSFNELRSNLVFRWEYRPGSHLYFVWSQDRTSYEASGREPVLESLGNLVDVPADNVFLVKVSRWWSL